MRYRMSTPLLLETIILKTLSLVLNAHSGTTRELGKEKVLDAIEGSADWAKVIVHDCSDSFADRVSQACAEPSDYIAVAGGDGTAAAVLNELVRVVRVIGYVNPRLSPDHAFSVAIPARDTAVAYDG